MLSLGAFYSFDFVRWRINNKIAIDDDVESKILKIEQEKKLKITPCTDHKNIKKKHWIEIPTQNMLACHKSQCVKALFTKFINEHRKALKEILYSTIQWHSFTYNKCKIRMFSSNKFNFVFQWICVKFRKYSEVVYFWMDFCGWILDEFYNIFTDWLESKYQWLHHFHIKTMVRIWKWFEIKFFFFAIIFIIFSASYCLKM